MLRFSKVPQRSLHRSHSRLGSRLRSMSWGSRSRGSTPFWTANSIGSRGPSTWGLVHLRLNRPRGFGGTRNDIFAPVPGSCILFRRLGVLHLRTQTSHCIPFPFLPGTSSLSNAPICFPGGNGTSLCPFSSSQGISICGSVINPSLGPATSYRTSLSCLSVDHQIPEWYSRHNAE